jgi:hypothetical protein
MGVHDVQHHDEEYTHRQRSTAPFRRYSLLEHNTLEEFADPVNYDQQDTGDTGVAFYTALAQETGGPVLRLPLARAASPSRLHGWDSR